LSLRLCAVKLRMFVCVLIPPKHPVCRRAEVLLRGANTCFCVIKKASPENRGKACEKMICKTMFCPMKSGGGFID
jgi:hypothetical protein